MSNGASGGLRSLAKNSKLPIEQIGYFPDADEIVIRDVERGILFLMAFWSGPSVRAFTRLTEVLSTMDCGRILKLAAVDVDGSPALHELPYCQGGIRGAGETAWIRNGSIVATSGLGLNLERFELNTLKLLSMA